MQTTIKQVSPVEYELEITATAEDLAPEFQKALRAQQARTQMKGFRQGKVPLSLVKKMYGQALAYGVADKQVQDVYEEQVLGSGEHDVLGQPKITQLDYEMDSDLQAVVRFGVRPEVELQDLSGEQLSKLTKEITDEDIDNEMERLRKEHADLVPVEDDPAGEDDLVVFDLQEIDAESGTPIIGKRDEDQQIFLNDPRVEENLLLKNLRDALLGKKAGDSVRFQFEHDQAHGEHGHTHGEHGHAHAHHFEATVKDVKRRDLPELDDAFAGEVSNDQVTTLDELREEVRKQLQQGWERRSRELFESRVVERMLELHPVPVPDSVIEVYLDSFIEDVKRRNDGDLPEGFDEPSFRAANREEAEQQARWMLIRDKIVEEDNIEVGDEDYDAFFEREAGNDDRLSAAQMRQFYEAMPQLKQQLDQRLLSEKVFDALSERFEIVEKDPESMEQEYEERVAQAEATDETPADETPADEAPAEEPQPAAEASDDDEK